MLGIGKKRKVSLAIIDSQFPQEKPLGFRNAETNKYLAHIKQSAAYAMSVMKPGPESWFSHSYGVTQAQFERNKKGYGKLYPQNQKRVFYLKDIAKHKVGLAYSYFLAETYTLLPFYEKNKIPFVFVLYPGGGFGLNNQSSDDMLRRIFTSPNFKAVIVTQKITEDYLVERDLCPKGKIEFIYGGFVQFEKNDLKKKVTYPEGKETIDVCFVAAKYSDRGVDKGYDMFIDSAKMLSKKYPHMRFHVVGDFSKSDIELGALRDKITFYGYRQGSFLINFYSRMDIFLAPNKPGVLYEGNFDGFPLGIDASYCGVALVVCDELNMNRGLYVDGKEIICIQRDLDDITSKMSWLCDNVDSLYRIAAAGMHVTQRLFDTSEQIKRRLRVFEKYTKLDYEKDIL